MKILVLTILIFSFSFDLLAASLGEIQEIRLAKAELALGDGNEQEAMRLLKKNILSKNFHKGSLDLLADLYFKRGHYHQSFKVNYYIIKKIHSKKTINFKNLDKINEFLYDLKRPSQSALGIYNKVAVNYFTLFQEGSFSESYKKQLIELSYKYFSIVYYYKYNLAQTNYFLGIIQGKRNKNRKAVGHLLEAREIFTDNENTNKEDIDNINFFLGESLLKNGQYDGGTLFLKDLYLNPKTNISIREYSKNYFNSLGQSYFYLSGFYNLGYNNNVHSLTDQQSKQFNDLQSSLDSENSYFNQKGASLFYMSNTKNYFSYSVNLNFNEEEMNNKNVSVNDTRYYLVGFEIKYDNLQKSVAKVSYSHLKNYFKEKNNSVYKNLQDSHIITPQYSHGLKTGTITYKFPYQINKKKNTVGNTSTSIGHQISYTPYWTSNYFSPNYSIQVSSVDEKDAVSRTKEWIFSFSNHSIFSNRLSVFSYFDFTINDSDDENFDNKIFSINGTLTYATKWLQGLNLTSALNKFTIFRPNSQKINTTTITGGISYSF